MAAASSASLPGEMQLDQAGVDDDAVRSEHRRFWIRLALVVGASCAFRLAYLLIVKRDDALVGDEAYYSFQARQIADGNGYRNPFLPGGYAATHAPLTAAALAPVSWSNEDPVLLQRLAMAIYGTGVVAGIGLLGRQIAGSRVGLIAAALTGAYGAFWLNDIVVMSETFAAAGVVAMLFGVYRYRSRPTAGTAVAIGGAIGLAGLARAELLVLGGVVAMVMIVATRPPDAVAMQRWNRRRYVHLVVAGLVAVAVIAPWVARNLVRFDETTLISTQDGLTLLGANCPPTYGGDLKGFWAIECADLVETPDGADQSVVSSLYRDAAIDYIGEHTAEVPGVVAARVGRGLSVWRVDQMTVFNETEGRSRAASWFATVQFWSLVPLALVGLWRWPPGMPRWPVVTAMAFAVVVIAGLYGIPRFRISFEVALVVAAAVAIDSGWTRRRTSLGND